MNKNFVFIIIFNINPAKIDVTLLMPSLISFAKVQNHLCNFSQIFDLSKLQRYVNLLFYQKLVKSYYNRQRRIGNFSTKFFRVGAYNRYET
jgi:hypothetical protein